MCAQILGFGLVGLVVPRSSVSLVLGFRVRVRIRVRVSLLQHRTVEPSDYRYTINADRRCVFEPKYCIDGIKYSIDSDD